MAHDIHITRIMTNEAKDASMKPYPWFNMMVLASAVLASAVSLSGLFPYVGFMVIDLGLAKNADQAGFYSGFIASGMMAGRSVSSIAWGRLADTYGRKPPLLFGCASICIFSIAFGLSNSLFMAVLARFLLGLFNPVWGVAKAMVSELVHPSQEPRAMGMVTACWSLGMVLGSMIGGLLANPCDLYPRLFGSWRLLRVYPYLLPNVATAVLGLAGGVLVARYLPETLPIDDTLEDTATPTRDTDNSGIVPQTAVSTCTDGRTAPVSSVRGASVSTLLSTPGVLTAVTAYFILSFISITFDETVVLWAIAYRVSGGLEMKQVHIGYLMSASGALLLVHTLWLYPKIATCLGNVKGFIFGQLAFIPFTFGLTCLPYLPRSLAALKFLLLLVFYAGGKGSCTLGFSSLGLLINQLVDRPQRASLNGLVMAVGSISKTVGPFTGAWLFAWSISRHSESIPFVDYRFVFVVLIVSAAVSAAVPVKMSAKRSTQTVKASTELMRVHYKAVTVDEDDVIDEDPDNETCFTCSDDEEVNP